MGKKIKPTSSKLYYLVMFKFIFSSGFFWFIMWNKGGSSEGVLVEPSVLVDVTLHTEE